MPTKTVSYKDFRKTTKRTQRENPIQRAIIDYLLYRGFLVIRHNGSAFSTDGRYVRAYVIANSGESAGLADVFAAKDGRMYFFEVKKADGTQLKSQKKFEALCVERGVFYRVVRSVEDVQNIIQ